MFAAHSLGDHVTDHDNISTNSFEQDFKQINCNYYSVDHFQDTFKNSSSTFSCLSLNIRSIMNKWMDLSDLVDDLNSGMFNFSVIALQEIWNCGSNSSLCLDKYQPLHFSTRDPSGLNMNCGGGVGLYISKK